TPSDAVKRTSCVTSSARAGPATATAAATASAAAARARRRPPPLRMFTNVAVRRSSTLPRPVSAGLRIPPGTRAEIGPLNAAVVRALGAATGGRAPNLFPTLARHRKLFLPWLRFAGRLMPGGLLPRADSELL